MSTWTAEDLDALGATTELDITTRRGDGTLRPAVPIWVVRVGDNLYIRSYRGRGGVWFRHATGLGAAHIHAAGLDRDVTVEAADIAARHAIDDAYWAKYARYGSSYVAPMVAGPAAEATLRLTPAS